MRDETFGEDRSPLSSGYPPQNLAALRIAGLNCLRHGKIGNIAATLRRFARDSGGETIDGDFAALLEIFDPARDGEMDRQG